MELLPELEVIVRELGPLALDAIRVRPHGARAGARGGDAGHERLGGGSLDLGRQEARVTLGERSCGRRAGPGRARALGAGGRRGRRRLAGPPAAGERQSGGRQRDSGSPWHSSTLPERGSAWRCVGALGRDYSRVSSPHCCSCVTQLVQSSKRRPQWPQAQHLVEERVCGDRRCRGQRGLRGLGLVMHSHTHVLGRCAEDISPCNPAGRSPRLCASSQSAISASTCSRSGSFRSSWWSPSQRRIVLSGEPACSITSSLAAGGTSRSSVPCITISGSRKRGSSLGNPRTAVDSSATVRAGSLPWWLSGSAM